MQQPVTQEHGSGCAVACVAFVLDLTYQRALGLFTKPQQAWGRGFYAAEVTAALKAGGVPYTHGYAHAFAGSLFRQPGVIVYVGQSNAYALGHYLVRTLNGAWMNSWSNAPCIAPAKSAFQKHLPGAPAYVIVPS